MAGTFVNRAGQVMVTVDQGPALTITPEPMPHALLFTFLDRNTGQTVTMDEEQYMFLRGEIDKTIQTKSKYNG